MKHLMFKLSLVTVFMITIIFLVNFISELSTTSDGSNGRVSSIEQNGDFRVVLAANKETKKNIIDFSWIEKGFDGQLDGIEFVLGTAKNEILSKRGDAIETGYYEGGEFFQYEDATFFVNPETNQLVAIALSMESHELEASSLKKVLGTPDVIERNEMEDLWMYEYYLDKYSLMFEAEEEDGKILFAWLRERL